MKEIWGAQNNQALYTIDEKVLQNRIQRKRNSVFTSISEWLSIIGYLVPVILLVRFNPLAAGSNIFLCLEAAWMFAIVVYLVVSHIRRIKRGRRFDRSVHGDLDHAIYLISAQMHLSQILRWNLLPMGVIMIFSVWKTGKLFLVSAGILVVYSLVFYAASKSLSANKRRKRKLQVLKEKLENASK